MTAVHGAGDDAGQSVDDGEYGPEQSPVLNPDGDFSSTEIGLLSYQQRLGRALIELLEHLPEEVVPQSGGVNATVVVSMELETLVEGLGSAVLDTGTEISAGQARRLACNATLLPLVLAATHGCWTWGRGSVVRPTPADRAGPTGRRLCLARLGPTSVDVRGASSVPVESRRRHGPRQRRAALRLPPSAAARR